MKWVNYFFPVCLILSFLIIPGQTQGYSESYKFLQAVKKLNYHDIKKSIGKGVNINTRDYDDKATALILSARMRQPILMKYLLKHGAKPDLYDEKGRTALCTAAAKGEDSMVAMLLKAKADLEIEDNNGYTPLIAAVVARKKSVVKILLEAGADHAREDFSGRSALKHAQEKRLRYIQDLLKKAGATR